MIAKEIFQVCNGRPCLGTMVIETVDCADIDAQFALLTVDLSAPDSGFSIFILSDQITHLFADPWAAIARTGFPSRRSPCDANAQQSRA